MSSSAFALTQDCSGDGVEGCEQCGGAVSNVVVRDPFDVAEPQGQDRLAALQRLNLALLIHTQDQGFIRWVQIQPDDVPYLLDEEGVVGKLKVTCSVRLQAEGAPDPVNGRFRQTCFCRQRTATPMRAVFRFGSQGSADRRGHLFIGNRTRPAGSQLLVQSRESLFHEPSSPEFVASLIPGSVRKTRSASVIENVPMPLIVTVAVPTAFTQMPGGRVVTFDVFPTKD